MVNLPNTLTFLRILIGIAVPFMMWWPTADPQPGQYDTGFTVRVWVAILFAFAAFTDWFDGWYARRYNLITKAGKILDPIADKVITLGCFVVLSDLTYFNLYSIWWIIPIALREIVITVYRILFLLQERAIVVSARWSGKAKTVVQMAALPTGYFYWMFREYGGIDLAYLNWAMYGMIIASLVLTLYSGFRFFEKNWKSIRNVSG